MASWEASKVDFAAANFFMALPQPIVDSGTTAIAAVKSLAISTGFDMDKFKLIEVFLNKVRDRLVIAGTNPAAAPMVEVDGAIDALRSNTLSLKTRMKKTPMEESMLAL